MGAEISLRLLQREVEKLKAELESRTPIESDKSADQGNTVATPASGGDGGDMNTRITNLERDMTEVKVSLGKVETRLGHIDQNMLTKGRAAVLALSAGIAVFAGGWWIVQQYLAPILASLPK